MAKVEIYTTFLCGYCARAKALLDAKGVGYTEHDVSYDLKGREAMIARAGGRSTVPQVFIDDRPIGGSDELTALERAGSLDKILEGRE